MRGTGVPTIRRKMRENGYPDPEFDFDEARVYFRVVLPAHPEYVVLHALRESARLWATGERQRAIDRLEEARRGAQHSAALVAQLIDYAAALGDVARAQAVFAEVEADASLIGRHLAYLALARAYLDRQMVNEARALLAKAPRPTATQEALELAVLHKRSGQLGKAHQFFADAYPDLQNNAKAVHEFATTKLSLARRVRSGPHVATTRRRLYREAIELLHRVVQLADSPCELAWARFDIAKALARLRSPETEVQQACLLRHRDSA